MRRKDRWIDTAQICIRFLKFMEDRGVEDKSFLSFLGDGIFYFALKVISWTFDKDLEENPYKVRNY